MRIFGEGVQVADQARKIIVSDIRFETEFVFERDSES